MAGEAFTDPHYIAYFKELKTKYNPVGRMRGYILFLINTPSRTNINGDIGANAEELRQKLEGTYISHPIDIFAGEIESHFRSQNIDVTEEEIRGEAKKLYLWLLEGIWQEINTAKQKEP